MKLLIQGIRTFWEKMNSSLSYISNMLNSNLVSIESRLEFKLMTQYHNFFLNSNIIIESVFLVV